MDTPEKDPQWERRLLEKIALESLKETRAKRRWGIFFKLVGLTCLVAVLLLFIDWGAPDKRSADGRHTALVNVRGTIDAGGDASAEKINAALQSAFEDKGTAGVILRINSPGGSPVQSGIVYDEIRRLRERHPNIPLYVVIEDVCASGGYFIASAADRIFVNQASIVGSIGVLMAGFGFTEAMQRIGVERRLLTAGENKGFFDPYSPWAARQKEHAETLLREIHEQFIGAVRKGRGARLRETPEMFSGLVWTGSQSIQLGLTDDFGTIDSVAREIIKAEDILDYSVRENIAERVAKRLGANVARGMLLRLFDADRAVIR